MTHDRMAPVMGLMMGAMIPLMVHGPMAGAGLAFVVVHVALAVIAASAVLFIPAARHWIRRHVPGRTAVMRMSLGLAAGFALICSHCLMTQHGAV